MAICMNPNNKILIRELKKRARKKKRSRIVHGAQFSSIEMRCFPWTVFNTSIAEDRAVVHLFEHDIT